MYLGNEKHLIFIGHKEIELSEEEISEIFMYAIENNIQRDEADEYEVEQHEEEIRPYNKNETIKNLFEKYYTKQQTKKEVLKKIAAELNISFKAAEKAFYKQ